jgi:hypothetical protein
MTSKKAARVPTDVEVPKFFQNLLECTGDVGLERLVACYCAESHQWISEVIDVT